jgi:hypothetical protein
MGIAYEEGAVTGPSSLVAPDLLPIDTFNRSRVDGNVVWYLDGIRGRLMRFDMDELHGTKVIDHRRANVRRYVDVHVSRRENVPGHMQIDSINRHLYISDTGAGRILRVKTDSGNFYRGAMCTHHQCYRHENRFWTCGEQTGMEPERGRFVNQSMCQTSDECRKTPELCMRDIDNLCKPEDGGWCRHGECAGDDGLGCYNAFTEMGHLYEYELWGCTEYEVFASPSIGDRPMAPSGIVLTPDGLVLVADYDSGIIVSFDKDGVELNRYDTGHAGLTALEIQCDAPASSDSDCKLWYTNTENKWISYVDILSPCETQKILPNTARLRNQACTSDSEPCKSDRDKTCQALSMHNRIRPDFSAHNGPSWQERMVILHSYGKNCTGLPNALDYFDPCSYVECDGIEDCVGTAKCRVGSNGRYIDAATGEITAWGDADAVQCPDRLDCDRMNPDLLVMAGFFCHPCLPNPVIATLSFLYLP